MGADGASLRNASAVPSETQSKRDLLRPLRGIMSKCPRGTCMDTWESSLGGVVMTRSILRNGSLPFFVAIASCLFSDRIRSAILGLGIPRKVYPRENWAILKKNESAHPKSTIK